MAEAEVEMIEGEKTVFEEDVSLAQANNYLAAHLHRLLSKENENVFFSPLSISVVMGMLLCGTEGDTASEIQKALGHKQAAIEKDNVATAFEQQMSLLLQPSSSYTLSCANCMVSQKKFQVKDEFKRVLIKSFKALLLEVDFMKESGKAIDQINEWVNEKTNNMIPKLVDELDPHTVMILLNAVYFKGTWMKQFKKEETLKKKFYNKGKKKYAKKIEMMHMEDNVFSFYEDKSFQALQLPYIGEKIAMMILLPRKKKGLPGIEAEFSRSFFKDLKKKLYLKYVEITLPRFRLEYMKSLKPHFYKLGVNKAFKPGAEFTFAGDRADIVVSEILHKAVIEVNEEGSEAVAVTSVRCCLCSTGKQPPDPVFVADHPFLFVIYDKKSDLILFMGRVSEL